MSGSLFLLLLNPPSGWRFLLITKGSVFKVKNVLNADFNGVLCPKHVKELLALLKKSGMIDEIMDEIIEGMD